jgi:predicted acyl esterase
LREQKDREGRVAEKSEIRDGMQVDWDVPITMEDGVVLRADIFRPVGAGKYPVIITYGPYGKGLDFKEGYKTATRSLSATIRIRFRARRANI